MHVVPIRFRGRCTHHLASRSGFPTNALNAAGGGSPSSRTPINETIERYRRALRIAGAELDASDWSVVLDVVRLEAALSNAGHEAGSGNDDTAAAALDRMRRGLAGLAVLRLAPSRRSLRGGRRVPPHRAGVGEPDEARRSGAFLSMSGDLDARAAGHEAMLAPARAETGLERMAFLTTMMLEA